MSGSHRNLYNVTSKHVDITDTSTVRNTLLYPIAKSFLETFPQHYDIIRTYEHSIESIADIIGKDCVVDEQITIDDLTFAQFRLRIVNVRIYPPDTTEAATHSNFGYIPTPNIALATGSHYTVVIIGDVEYSYTIRHVSNQSHTYLDYVEALSNSSPGTTYSFTIPNGYIVNVPIPIGSRWCTLTHYDLSTLIKSGEEMKSMYGYFVIDGHLRHIVPIYKKPFNKPIVTKADVSGQISRTDVLYTKGYEYENSYYVIGVMVTPKSAHTGRLGATVCPPDFGFSLQLNDKRMNNESAYDVAKRTHKFTNFVPIKYLFTAFGCTTDEAMLQYICPQMNDFGLINAISYACLQGHMHREAARNANIPIKTNSNYLIYEEPLTPFVAKYIIGNIILNDHTKQMLLDRSNKDEMTYRSLIVSTVDSIFDERFMPGVGDRELGSKVDRNVAICVELGVIVSKLYLVGYGLEQPQDKTSLTNRRVRNGQQMSREFKAFHGARIRELVTEVRNVFQENRDHGQINTILLGRIKKRFESMSGDQSRSLINSFKGTSKERSKMRTETITCKNQAFVWNHIREIVISSELKVTGTTVSWDHRTVNQTEMFFICPTQTPEAGMQTGRFKTPTLYTYVTLSTSGKDLIAFIQSNRDYIPTLSSVRDPESYFVIRMNGSILGYVKEYEPVESMYESLMEARSSGKVEVDASVVLNRYRGELDVWCDTGRLVSPFVIVKGCFDVDVTADKGGKDAAFTRMKGTCQPKQAFVDWLYRCSTEVGVFYDGIRQRFIELLDPEMAVNNAVIAPSLKEFYERPTMYTHVALPNHLHGIIASLVPALNLNAGVRAAYSTNHVKQAIGPTMRYPMLKYVNDNNILIAPQIPLVRPCTYDYLHMNETPCGQNVIVAFMQFKYNQEDAVILNQTSVEHGLLKIDSITTRERDSTQNGDEFCVPPPGTTLTGNPDSYAKIDVATALPKNVGDLFYTNDCLIASVRKKTEGVSDTSVRNDKLDGRYPLSANPRPLRYIVKNKIHGENTKMKMAVFGQYRVPIAGDKFNSEHAQKGTCGRIMPPELLPYTTNGVRPDIIFNPPSIFKRKTYGQVYLAMMAKLSALLGCPVDCTPYHTVRDDEDVCRMMKQLGLDDAGYETMYDPVTGRPYKSRIFFGNHYWERQSHLVEQKINVRNGGHREATTNQPKKGRKVNGGQVIDVMSFNAHVASGITEIVRDSRLNQGSKIRVSFCKRCYSMMGYLHAQKNKWECSRCGEHADIVVKEVPPASVLLNHILNGLHVAIDYFDSYDEGDVEKALPLKRV